MKILYANLMFQLPDDFEGTGRDALRLIADRGDVLASENGGVFSDLEKDNPLSLEEEYIFNKAQELLHRRFEQSLAAGHKGVNFANFSDEQQDWLTVDSDGKPISGEKE